jgi:hypothetical protein
MIDAGTRQMQAMINSGMAWRMEGSYGRGVMELIRAGNLMLGPVGRTDYWGNYVPGREEVVEGTKGSFDYVKAHHGDDYAKALAKVGEEVL